MSVDRGKALVEVEIQPGVPRPKAEARLRARFDRAYEAPRATLVEVTDASIETTMCVVYTRSNKYLPDSLRNANQAIKNGYRNGRSKGSLILPKRRSTVTIDSTAVLMGVPAGGNYMHWLIEALSRELLVRDLIPGDTVILVPRLKSMERATLSAAGVNEEQLLELDPDAIVRVPRLYVPSRGLTKPGRFVPAAMTALHGLSEIWMKEGAADRERIFISRAGARHRRIANEEALLEVLEPRGFVSLALERLSPTEQIDRFARAEMVVALHGAGLVNVVFSRPGATVIELQPPGLDESRIQLYWNLAAAMGHRYVQVVCPGRASESAPDDPSRQDVIVDGDQVGALVDRLDR